MVCLRWQRNVAKRICHVMSCRVVLCCGVLLCVALCRVDLVSCERAQDQGQG